jgi:hypothetical protein
MVSKCARWREESRRGAGGKRIGEVCNVRVRRASIVTAAAKRTEREENREQKRNNREQGRAKSRENRVGAERTE